MLKANKVGTVAAPSFPSIPFAEAIAALQRRGINLVPSDHWATVWQQTHQASFTVARSAGFDILGDVHKELVRVLAEGRTFQEFARDLTPTLQRKGWWGTVPGADPQTGEVRDVQLGSTRRLRTIYDVNLRVSQAQGNWERQQAQKATRPYLRYVGIVDGRIRPEHRIWHGRILPVDHAWWKTHYPPNGWRCRCTVMSLSEDDLEDFDFTVSPEPPDDGTVPWRNPATGEIVDVPRGIDPGWAYNPGAVDQAARTERLLADKACTLPGPLGRTAFVAAVNAMRVEACEAGGAASVGVRSLVTEGLAAWMDEVDTLINESIGLAGKGRQRLRELIRGGYANWATKPGMFFPLGVVSQKDAASVNAVARVALLSPDSYDKQRWNHPELTVADYLLVQDAIERGERYKQGGNNIAFVLNAPGGVVVIVKATQKGDELYITSMRRLSPDKKERDRTIRKLIKE